MDKQKLEAIREFALADDGLFEAFQSVLDRAADALDLSDEEHDAAILALVLEVSIEQH